MQYAREGLEELDDGVDLLIFCNEQRSLSNDTTTVEDALAQLRFKNHTVVITQSAKGALVSNSTQHFHVAGRHVEAVDTNGAGDAFAGAFLYAPNHHQDLNACCTVGRLDF